MAWLNLRRDDPKTKNSLARDAEVFSRRLTEVLSSSNGVTDAEPEEVEARIRNMTHGSGRD
jgi:hypothetical protein